ncbi:MAG: aminotransferase class V-fold PLP-dependent enzyme [Gammaproteobacteria bacterium]
MNEADIITHFRKQFVQTDRVHLNNAAITPMSKAAQQAIQHYTDLMVQHDTHTLTTLIQHYEKSRQTTAQLIGAKAENIAFMQTTAAAISQVALGFDWRKGDEIVLYEDEYPSNIYPWLVAAKKFDLKINWIPVQENYQLDTQQFIEAITPRTRVVAVSWVQYRTGAMVNLKQISQACKQGNAWLVVDGIQGIGIIPFDLQNMGVDALCGGCHKWLCAGIPGHGYLALAADRSESLHPLLHGTGTYGELGDPSNKSLTPKKGARKFEPGSPNIMASMATAASAQLLLDTGLENIHQHALKLAQQLRTGLLQQDVKILSSSTSQSPIVTFIPPGKVSAFTSKLQQNNIYYTQRNNTIRLAPHGFNTTDHIDKVLALL